MLYLEIEFEIKTTYKSFTHFKIKHKGHILIVFLLSPETLHK